MTGAQILIWAWSRLETMTFKSHQVDSSFLLQETKGIIFQRVVFSPLQMAVTNSLPVSSRCSTVEKSRTGCQDSSDPLD